MFRFLTTAFEVVDEPIYHYTSGAGLIGILRDARLWASEASSLNDLSEGRHGWELITEWSGRQKGTSPAFEVIRESLQRATTETSEIFVVSASVLDDDANQWRLYGDHGSGYSVRLDPAARLYVASPASIASAPPASKPSSDWVSSMTPWLRVIYDPPAAEDALDMLCWGANEVWRLADTDAAGVARAQWSSAVGTVLATIATLVKPSGFRGESEVRKVVRLPDSALHQRHRSSPHGVVSYVELAQSLAVERGAAPGPELDPYPIRPETVEILPNGAAGARLPVRGVRLGPGLRAENVRAVRRLASSGWNPATFDILQSVVPLRR